MALTRRGFLGWLATATVSACVVSKVPTDWLPQPIRQRAALDFLRKHFNEWMDATRGRPPRTIWAGQKLYEALESEIEAIPAMKHVPAHRPLGDRPCLMFKGVTVERFGTQHVWNAIFVGDHCWENIPFVEGRRLAA